MRRVPTSRRPRPLASPSGLAGVAGLLAVVLLATVGGGCSAGADQGAGSGPRAGGTVVPSTSVPAASSRPTDGPTTRRFEEYVALGDSYSSAPGVPTTDERGGCKRSDHNYAHLVTDRLDVRRLVDATCAGARTADLAGSQQTLGGGVAPQLDALTERTDLVTLGIGVNDLNLMILLVTCLGNTDGACAAEAADELPAGLRRLRTDLDAGLRAIRDRSPAAEVLVVGYPQLFGAERCEALPVAEADAAFGARAITEVNGVLRDAARAAGATYVDVEGPSAGHEICSAEPWVNGAVRSRLATPLHPFPRGQEAVADLVVEALTR